MFEEDSSSTLESSVETFIDLAGSFALNYDGTPLHLWWFHLKIIKLGKECF